MSEAVRRNVIAQRLPSHDWPDRDLRITAIDIGTGELVAFDRKSGVELVDAVAASCAVPGAWPLVTIGERRYMDGGVGSTMNLKLATDCESVGVLVPSGKGVPSPFGRDPALEVDGFPAARWAYSPMPIHWRRSVPIRWIRHGSRRHSPGVRRDAESQPRSQSSSPADQASRALIACAVSSWPMSMTSAARWNSRLRQAVRGTSIRRSGG